MKNILVDMTTLFSLASQFRDQRESEENYEKNSRCFDLACQDESIKLANFLRSHGVRNVKRVLGRYRNLTDEDFSLSNSPDSYFWNSDEPDTSIEGEKHWWVMVNNKWIVDTTADQFHPSNRDDYAVIVTPVSNPDYTTDYVGLRGIKNNRNAIHKAQKIAKIFQMERKS